MPTTFLPEPNMLLDDPRLWRRVEIGLWLKLAAMAACMPALAVFGLTWLQDDYVLMQYAAGGFVVGIVLDAVGRLMCLFGPRHLAGRGRIIGSVVSQAAALCALGIFIVLGPAAPDAALVVAIAAAILLQFFAAWLFVSYLCGLAKTLDRASLLSFSIFSLTTLSSVAGVLVAGVIIVALAVLSYLLLARHLLLFFLGYAVFMLVVLALTLLVAFVVSVMYIAYAIALVGIARENHTRLGEPVKGLRPSKLT